MAMKRLLRVEELEERIAPTVISAGGNFTFTDADGDQIRISYFGPDGSQADATDGGGGDLDAGDSIGWITVSGNDYTSALLVENLGGGDGHTDILKGVQTAAAGKFGVIGLGIDAEGNAAGQVDLGAAALVAVDGDLQMLVLNGDMDFDIAGQGHTVVVQGDVGLLEVRGDMYLDPANGARIAADGGAGDISFIHVGGAVYEGTAGPLLPTVEVGTGVTFADDAGDGTVAAISVRVSGGTGALTLIPVIDGGAVLSNLELSDGASAIISTSGGGDVTDISSAGAVGTVTVSGAPDTDVFSVSGAGIAGVLNRTIGGDVVGVHSTGAIANIQTQRIGNLGAAFTGSGNSVPLVAAGALSEMGGVDAVGDITTVRVGGIANTSLAAANVMTLLANPGGMTGVEMDVTGTIGRAMVETVENSTVYAGGGIGFLRVGAGGIMASEIASEGTIGAIQTTGSITDSLITTKFEDISGAVFGADIGRLQAGSVYSSQIQSFGGFGSVMVGGIVSDSSFEARFNDIFLGADVGGPVGVFNVVGMYNSSLNSFGDISTLTVGTGGMVEGSQIDTSGSITRASIRGDFADVSIINAAVDIGNMTVNGDMAFDARISAGRDVGTLNIGGALVGGDLIVAGNLSRFSVRGGVNGVGVAIGVGGSLGYFSVSGGFYGAGPAIMDVTGDLDNFSVRGGLARLSLSVGGNVRNLSAAAGGVVQTTIMNIAGNLASARIRGSNSSLTVGGQVGNLQLLSDVSGFTADVAGPTGNVNVIGTLTGLSELNLAGTTGTVNVTGDVNNSSITIGADGAPASAGRISIGGTTGSADIQVWGNLDQLSARGGMISSGLFVQGDLSQALIARGMYGSLVNVDGSAGRFIVTNAVHDSTTSFDGGVSDYSVRGSIYNANIRTTHYDGGGNPLGGRIGRLTAADMTNTNVSAYGGIADLNVRGTIYGAAIEAVGRDNSGAGSIVGGGAIGRISAKGLNNTEVIAFTNIDQLSLGDEGISETSSVATVTGNLGSISTRGLIYGDIDVAGDLTGSILTGGTDAVDLGTGVDYYFTDANGVITGGTLTVGGSILGTVS